MYYTIDDANYLRGANTVRYFDYAVPSDIVSPQYYNQKYQKTNRRFCIVTNKFTIS
jgi:hypothetical protein